MDDGYLTWNQIRAAYPDQWVMIRRPNDQRWGHDPLGGWVLAHSPNQEEINRAMDESPVDPALVSLPTGGWADVDAREVVHTLEYITWRESVGLAGYLYEADPFPELAPPPPPPPRRWWHLWR
jgi:hypothetical protein